MIQQPAMPGVSSGLIKEEEEDELGCSV